MAVRLRITGADGKARDVVVQPGEAIPVQPGDRVVVLEPPREALSLLRVDGNLIILVQGAAYTLAGFFPTDEPPPVPGKPAPKPLALAPEAAGAPADQQLPPPTLLDSQGQTLATSEASPLGGYSPLIYGNTPLPEYFTTPENFAGITPGGGAAGGTGGTGGGGNPPAPPPPPGPDNSQPAPDISQEVAPLSGSMLSIANAGAVEGGFVTFTITRSGALTPTTVDFSVINGSAVGGADFQGVPGTVSFAANEASKTITVATVLDSVLEPTETFQIVLSNATNGSQIDSSAGTATGVIIDDSPIFSVSAASATEGGSVVFAVTRTGGTQGSLLPVASVDFATADGTAFAGADYTAATGTVTFGAGQTVQFVTVQTALDTLLEASETFQLTLSNPTLGAVLSASATTATGTVIDDSPIFSVNAASATEGGAVVFAVTRSGGTQGSLLSVASVDFATLDGTAGAGGDYAGTAGRLTFTAGETVQFVTVQTTQDLLLEGNETFQLALTNPTLGAVLSAGAATATGTITDDVPVFSVGAAAAAESGSIVFQVTRTGGLHYPTLTIDFATADGTAAAGTDYTATNGTLTFGTGETVQFVTVQTAQDALFESDETFTLALSNQTAGTLVSAPSATGTIQNDDPNPVFSVAGAANGEGLGIIFTVTRTGDAQADQAITFSTTLRAGDTAGPSDFVPGVQTLTFVSGQTSQTVTVASVQDNIFEPNETFGVVLSGPTNGALLHPVNGVATGTINNDDAQPAAGISTASGLEGPVPPPAIPQNSTIVFTVTRTGDAQNVQTVEFSTTIAGADTAQAGDFVATAGTLTFAQGVSVQTITVTTLDDNLQEGNETFTVLLGNPAGGLLLAAGADRATGTIIDNDTSNFLLSNAAGQEGTGADGAVVFTVSRTADSGAQQTVAFATTLVGGNSASGGDFTGANGTLTFNPGEFAKTFTVTTTADAVFENDETFTALLVPGSATGGATIGIGNAIGTILNDEPAPVFTLNGPAAAIEGTGAGSGGVLTFTVTRSGDSQLQQTVRFNTTLAGGDTASAADFVGRSGALTFNLGDTEKTFTVQASPDAIFEGGAGTSETFNVGLSSATGGATVAPGTAAVGTIEDDEAAPTFSIAAATTTEGTAPGAGGQLVFTVTRNVNAQGQQTVAFDATVGGLDTASGNDFTATSGVLTFSLNDTFKTFTVQGGIL